MKATNASYIKIILLFGICVLFILQIVSAEILTFAYKSYDTDTKTITFDLKKGWAAIPNGRIVSGTCEVNRDLSYIYSPTKGAYIPRYSSGMDPSDRIIIETDAVNGFRYASTYTGGIFQYLDKDCTITMRFFDGIEKDKEIVKIKKGWNFITITPDMTKIPARYIFGNCKLTAINGWVNNEAFCHTQSGCWGFNNGQSEDYKNTLMGFENEQAAQAGQQIQVSVGTPEYEAAKFPRDLIGVTYVMKFADDCEFNFDER